MLVDASNIQLITGNHHVYYVMDTDMISSVTSDMSHHNIDNVILVTTSTTYPVKDQHCTAPQGSGAHQYLHKSLQTRDNPVF